MIADGHEQYIDRQLEALELNRSTWRRFRLHETVCRRCGTTVAEVMDTDPSPVLVTWQPAMTNVRGAKEGRPAALVPTVRPAAFRGIWVIPDDRIAPPSWPAHWAHCRCALLRIDHAETLADLASEKRRRLLQPERGQ